MTFPELLAAAIERSEIPLRFEPGATEAVAGPVTAMLHAWLVAHLPPDSGSPIDQGKAALVFQLLEELSGSTELPGVDFPGASAW
jgi:hypothetical protein